MANEIHYMGKISDLLRHCPLRPNSCQPCLLKFYTCQSDTRAIGRHQKCRCNTTLLLVLDQPLAELQPECESRLHCQIKDAILICPHSMVQAILLN